MADGNSLAGLRVVVTGASSGIGRATAIRLAQWGASVFVHYHHNRSGAEETLAAARSAASRPSHACHAADLASKVDRDALINQAWRWGEGRIDAWINNAGADVLTGEAARWSFEAKLDRLWEVDVRATILLSREVMSRMKEQPQDRSRANRPLIVFTGWDQAWTGMEGDAGQMFGSIKGAVMAAAKSFAQEGAPQVRVNCVAPGWIRTSWGQGASTEWQSRAIGESLLARWGEPEDVASAIAFLCSPQSEFLNGQILPINGGWRRH